MKIALGKPGSNGNIDVEGEKIYVDISPETTERIRHDGQIVMAHGWINLDYSREGYLVGLEFVEGDPLKIDPPQYLRPQVLGDA
jgi:hypothetical protein